MKIRIEGDSVRFRLSKPEVERFAKEGYLESVTDFGLHQFTYAINRVRDAKDLYADFDNGLLVLHVPSKLAEEWTGSEIVSLDHKMDIDGCGKTLSLLLEKDFKCKGREGDTDQADKFENPNSAC